MSQEAAVKLPSVLLTEKGLWAGAATTVLFLLFGGHWLKDLSNPVVGIGLFLWLFVVILLLSLVTGRHLDLGLEPLEMVMLLLTLVVSLLSFGGGRTTVLQGVVHLLLFSSYVMLIFD